MQDLKLPEHLKKNIHQFSESLKELYQDNLVAIILYGSAASGERIENHSNINILIVLKKADLPTLELSRKIIQKHSAKTIEPLFLSQDYVFNSLDVFPIEFLDMKENHSCLYGQDILKDIKIDLKNLKFQCEQELRSKFLLLKQHYLRVHPRDRAGLLKLLFKNFTSLMHILKNVVRLKGKSPSTNKENLLKEISAELHVETSALLKILQVSKTPSRIKVEDTHTLLSELINNLEQIVIKVDRL